MCYWAGDQTAFFKPSIVIGIGRSLILCLSMSPLLALAQMDFMVGCTTRSYPLSGVIETELGYGQVLWGGHQASSAPTVSPWYGYVRPKLESATAATYNSGAVTLEVFPLSFLGGRAGGESIQNDRDYSAYDCDSFGCRGRFYRTFAEAEFAMGAGRVFVQGRWRRDRWTQGSKSAADFVDPTSGLLMAGHGESQTVYLALAGANVSNRWSLLAFYRYAESDAGEISRFPFAVINYKIGEFSVGLGAGIFKSALKEQSGSAIAFVRWEPWPSVALK